MPGCLASVILMARFFSWPASWPSPASLPSCPHTSTVRWEEGHGGSAESLLLWPSEGLVTPTPRLRAQPAGLWPLLLHHSSQGLVTRPSGGSQARGSAVTEQRESLDRTAHTTGSWNPDHDPEKDLVDPTLQVRGLKPGRIASSAHTARELWVVSGRGGICPAATLSSLH